MQSILLKSNLKYASIIMPDSPFHGHFCFADLLITLTRYEKHIGAFISVVHLRYDHLAIAYDIRIGHDDKNKNSKWNELSQPTDLQFIIVPKINDASYHGIEEIFIYYL